jgi:hypothetical protein
VRRRTLELARAVRVDPGQLKNELLPTGRLMGRALGPFDGYWGRNRAVDGGFVTSIN